MIKVKKCNMGDPITLSKTAFQSICKFYNNLTNFSTGKKSAFTLAEVLITLGIIGFIAAMTIPTLMQKTNDKEIVAGLLKIQSVFSNALKEIEAVEGVKLQDMTQDIFETYISNHLKTVLCSGTNYDLCLADGTGITYDDSFTENCTNNYQSNGASPALQYGCREISVDVNGNKGPNKYGYDQYKFAITKNGLTPYGEQDSCVGSDCTTYVLFNNKLKTGLSDTGNMESSGGDTCGDIDIKCIGVPVCINGNWECEEPQDEPQDCDPSYGDC